MRYFHLATVVSFCFVLSLTGCGGGRGEVRGKVTYQGKTVTSGFISFVSAKGEVSAAEIQPDGTYHVVNVPTGEMKVAVSSPDPDTLTAASDDHGRNQHLPPKKKDPKSSTWFPIPPNYADPDGTELKTKIHSGPDNKFDIDLT